MTLSEYIKRLQALEENHGGKEVVITEEGYYAQYLAEVYDFPLISKVQIAYNKFSENECIVLGNSYQSY